MGGPTVFATSLELWKERRLSALTNSTCGSSMSNSPSDHDVESVYTHRSSVSSHRTRSRSFRMSKPIYEEHDERSSVLVNDSAPLAHATADQQPTTPTISNMFTTASVRVWKQTPLPEWMKVFVPRHVKLVTGSHPCMEYSRQENGAVRQRVHLTTATQLARLPKNKLVIDFHGVLHKKTAQVAPFLGATDEKKSAKRQRDENQPPTSPSTLEKWTLRFKTKHERDLWAKKIQDAVDLLAWINKFTLGQVLTESGASTLAECFTWLDQGQPSYVLKAMTTETKKQSLAARDEIHLHHLLTNFSSHPHVLTLHDSFRQQERAYLVLEYCAGGDLFEFLRKEGAMDEASAKTLFRCVAEAIAYIHDHNVVHLDIKPENLMFHASPTQVESIKLGDFGSAQLITDPTGQVRGLVNCTIGYAAPEVLENGEVSFAADVFSAGAVLYTILCGFAPFQSSSVEETMERNVAGDFSFDDLDCPPLSAQAKDLLYGMLEVEPRERLSMDEVLNHAWLRS